MIKEIKITNDVSFYVINIDYNKDKLLKEIKLNMDVNGKSSRISTDNAPGFQSTIVIESDEINRIKKIALEILGNELNCNIENPHYHKCWSYTSNKENKYEFYHKHLTHEGTNLTNIEWTHTFYVQMPNNLEDDDGYLFFKTDDGIEYKTLPCEGDLMFFPASLGHKPKINKNSTIDRVVLAGVFKSLSTENKIIKEDKSLI